MRKITNDTWEVDGNILNLCNHDGFKHFVDFTKDGFVLILNNVLPKMTHVPGSQDGTVIPIDVSPSEYYEVLSKGLQDASEVDFESIGRVMVKLMAVASAVATIDDIEIPFSSVSKLLPTFVNNAYSAVHCSVEDWNKHLQYLRVMEQLKNSSFGDKKIVELLSLPRGKRKEKVPSLNIPWVGSFGLSFKNQESLEVRILNISSDVSLQVSSDKSGYFRIFKTNMSMAKDSHLFSVMIDLQKNIPESGKHVAMNVVLQEEQFSFRVSKELKDTFNGRKSNEVRELDKDNYVFRLLAKTA